MLITSQFKACHRAWHSDRGSIIQQIFRVVSKALSSVTRKNREWQEKLLRVVFKAKEIVYSKANSETEYVDPGTLWERHNDAVDTIIRRDGSTETGQFLQPCIEDLQETETKDSLLKLNFLALPGISQVLYMDPFSGRCEALEQKPGRGVITVGLKRSYHDPSFSGETKESLQIDDNDSPSALQVTGDYLAVRKAFLAVTFCLLRCRLHVNFSVAGHRVRNGKILQHKRLLYVFSSDLLKRPQKLRILKLRVEESLFLLDF